MKLSDLLATVIAVPVLGLLMGGVYSVPAMYATKCRDPGYTLLLGLGLVTTECLVGFGFGLPAITVAIAASVAVAVLAIRRYFGPLDHNLERFGIIHALTLAGTLWLVIGRKIAGW
jgi:hypothetical protein